MDAFTVILTIASFGLPFVSVAEAQIECIDVCLLDLCKNGATCLNVDACYFCTCAPGYTGERCDAVMPCIPDCGDNGQCFLGNCICNPGYTGDYCQTLIPCYPGCDNGATCIGDTCVCPPGYTGPLCESEMPCVPECANGVCLRGECICNPGYTGNYCQSPIGCFPGCDNGGSCFEDICICPPGYTGRLCETIIDPGEGYSCNPLAPNYACTPYNLENGHYRFPLEGDCSSYIWCVEGPPVQCVPTECPEGLIWDPFENTCNVPTPEYPCDVFP